MNSFVNFSLVPPLTHRSNSPRPDAVFVLVVKNSPEISTVEVIGTAFALDTPTRNIAMTTRHCIYLDNKETNKTEKVSGTLFLVSKVQREADGLHIAGSQCYHVEPFHRCTADICLLRITTCWNPANTRETFPERIPLCPPDRMPTGESYEVRVIQCPATVFHHMRRNVLKAECGNWSQTSMVEDDHFFVESIAGPGSSGGPAINRNGEVVGMVQTGMLPSMSVQFEEVDEDDKTSQWSAKISASGQISGLIKIVMIKVEHHPSFPGLVSGCNAVDSKFSKL